MGWGVSPAPRPHFTPRKDPLSIVQETGWAPGPVWTGAENLAPNGIRFPDRLARSQSLYRLSYPRSRFVRSEIQSATHCTAAGRCVIGNQLYRHTVLSAHSFTGTQCYGTQCYRHTVLPAHSVIGTQCYRHTVLSAQCYQHTVLSAHSIIGTQCYRQTVLSAYSFTAHSVTAHSVTGTQCYRHTVLPAHSVIGTVLPAHSVTGTQCYRHTVLSAHSVTGTQCYRYTVLSAHSITGQLLLNLLHIVGHIFSITRKSHM